MDASLTTEILALIDRCKLEHDDPKCLGTFEVLERIENLCNRKTTMKPRTYTKTARRATGGTSRFSNAKKIKEKN